MAAVPLRSALRLAALAGRSLLWQNLALRLGQGALPLLGLLAMQRLLDAVQRGVSGVPDVAAEIWFAVGAASVIALFGAVIGAVATAIGERHARLCGDRCASLVQRHAAALDLEQVESPEVRDLLHRAAGDALTRPTRVVQDLAAFVVASAMLVSMVLATATAAVWLPLVVALAAVPQVLVRHRHSRLQFSWQEANTGAQRRLGYLAGILVGRPWAKDVRLLDLAEPLAIRVDRQRARLTEEQLDLMRRRTRAETAAQALSTLAMFAAYAFLAFAALRSELTLGGLLLQAQAVQRTQNGMRDSLLAHAALRDDQRFVQHLFRFLSTKPTLALPAAVTAAIASRVPAGSLAIALRGVCYSYPGSSSPALRGVDLEIAAGERIALLGGNGAGKSTLVRLLCRLALPTAGEVLLNGVDLRTVAAAELRGRVAVFFQDTVGFELTVRDNLEFGAEAKEDASLRARAAAAGLDQLLTGLPDDFGTPLGRSFAGSHELSAGQWRRLLLVRTLLRPADLLVLDEPFAFLDAAAQRVLARYLSVLPRPCTVLWIDHRPPDSVAVDRIVHLEGGQVRAS
jgi:ATP-binding cassette subfamily B protein